ncbi:hypothetical protein [Clostridium tarantellae]|uniref:DUF4834 family protein n=1 Tax=Clostridium tarantellae TaxID=39493 RepID=A0A6I1MQR8_9CLOT|nr:hypothetical protein [Clostridium tarantellae]MPQ43221.1 hypothetical protein [Clostridium tarantellae]
MKKYLSIIVIVLIAIIVFNLVLYILPIILFLIAAFWLYFKLIKPQILKFKHKSTRKKNNIEVEEEITSVEDDNLYEDGPVIDVDYEELDKDLDKKSKD